MASGQPPEWLTKSIEIHNYHAAKLKNTNANWSMRDTAKALGVSHGGVCEAILVASWCRTHRNQLEQFSYMRDALAFIRDRKKAIEQREII